MSTEVPQPRSRIQVRRKWDSLQGLTGNCPAAANYLKQKSGTFRNLAGFADAVLRGFAQLAVTNNPITGLMIMFALLGSAPDVFLVCLMTGVLGLSVSMLIRDSSHCIANGLTIYNPMLVGVVSYAILPHLYGPFDGFSTLLLILAVVYSVYIARATRKSPIPCLALPYLISEYILIIVLKHHAPNVPVLKAIVDNETSIEPIGNNLDPQIADIITTVDWSLVFRGSVSAAAQLFAVDDVAAGFIIYFGVLIYSPISACFSFLGAFVGSIVALGLGEPYEKIYSGFWGFSCLLTGAVMGGNFFVLNGQTTVATIAGIVLTSILQHVLGIILDPVRIPQLTVSFHLATWLFLGNGLTPEGAFNFPDTMTYPEKHRRDYRNRRLPMFDQPLNADEPEMLIKEDTKAIYA